MMVAAATCPLWLKKILLLCIGGTLFCAWKCAFISGHGFDPSKGVDIACAMKCVFLALVQYIPYKFFGTEQAIVAAGSMWSEMDDPVMGGGSKGTVYIPVPGYSSWQGAVKNVSFLHAPGFCSIETGNLTTTDASAYIKGGLVMKVRTSTPDFTGFKARFSSPSIPKHHGQHGGGSGSHAQGFRVPASKNGEWQSVFLPFNKFSYDWSDYTGDCATKDPDGYQHRCCSEKDSDVCPSAKQLNGIDSVKIYAEGVEGDFHMDVKEVLVTDCAHGGGMFISSSASAHSSDSWKTMLDKMEVSSAPPSPTTAVVV
jgi:hypothetical protein